MKKNGFISTAFIGLFVLFIYPVSAQFSLHTGIQKESGQIISQISTYPDDLYDLPFKTSSNYVSHLQAPVLTYSIRPDSVVLYVSSVLNQRETYVYDPDGNLQKFVREIYNGAGWQFSEMNSYSYDENHQLVNEIMQVWIDFFWEKTYQLSYTYDLWGHLLAYRIQNWDNGKWNDFSLISYIYNNDGNIRSYLEQSWSNSEWINMYQVNNSYDDKGFLTYSIREVWTGDTWINSSQNINTFNERGRIITTLSQVWTNSDWRNTEYHSYIYDDNENIISHLHMLHAEEWVNYMYYSYLYDMKGNNILYSEQQWDNGAWINKIRITRSFDEFGNKLTELNEEWSTEWNNVLSAAYSYDESGNCLNYTSFYWNNQQWENYMKTDYTYDQGMVYGTGYNWDGSNWVNADSWMDLQIRYEGELFYFLGWWGSGAVVYFPDLFFTNVSTPSVKDEIDMSIYPNPAAECININLKNESSGQILLLDLSGKVISAYDVDENQNSDLPITIPVNSLSSGVYFVEFTNATQTIQQKVSVVK